MKEKPTVVPVSAAPGRYGTPQRVGQPGEQDQRRAGPSPLSGHPTGPHAPYDADDGEGTAAVKHGTSRDGEPGSTRPKVP